MVSPLLLLLLPPAVSLAIIYFHVDWCWQLWAMELGQVIGCLQRGQVSLGIFHLLKKHNSSIQGHSRIHLPYLPHQYLSDGFPSTSNSWFSGFLSFFALDLFIPWLLMLAWSVDLVWTLLHGFCLGNSWGPEFWAHSLPCTFSVLYSMLREGTGRACCTVEGRNPF